ncbi:MAG: hypothetical protein II992_09950 [Lachnospiraceae bacterium]|nr:hypothetical protein [Lachnospiraceae bacterium]
MCVRLNKIVQKNYACYFIFFSIVLCYAAFLYMDFFTTNKTHVLKYVTIFLLILFYFLENGLEILCIDPIRRVTGISLCLAFVADYFLLLTYDYIWGIGLFCLVQICNLLQLRQIYECKICIMEHIVNFFIGIYIAMIHYRTYMFIILVICYFLLSVGNLFYAWRLYINKSKKIRFLAISISLLALCDLNVALWNVFGFVLCGNLIWLFYIPSQIFLEMHAKVW